MRLSPGLPTIYSEPVSAEIKMRLISKLLILTMFLLFNQTFGQTVKKKSYYSFSKGKQTLTKKEEFDYIGNIIRETRCLDKGCTKVQVKEMIYNNKGQLVQDSTYTNKYGYHQLIWRTQYTYHNNGLLKTEKKINEGCADGFDDLNTFYYDSLDRLVKIQNENRCDNDHYFDYPIYIMYDSIGNKIENIAKYSDTTTVFYKNIYSYDANGNLTSDTYFFHKEDSLELSSIRAYEYDSLNQLTKEKRILSETNSDSTSFEYYDNGLLKTEIKHPQYSDELLRWIKYVYNENDYLIERQHYYQDKNGRKRKGTKEIVRYEFY